MTKKPSKKIQTTLKPSLYAFIVQLSIELEVSNSQAIAYCVKATKETEKRI